MIVNNMLIIGDMPFSSWQMIIDLQNLVDTAGVVEICVDPFGNKYKRTITKKSEARKMLKFIDIYIDPEDRPIVDETLKANEIVWEMWEKIRCTKKKK